MPSGPASAPSERRRVLFAAAAVTLLFGLTDYLALGRFSPAAAAVRLGWAALLVAGAVGLGRLSPARERALFGLVAAASGAAFAELVALTGGVRSPMFHWILATPLTVAVVIQDYPSATAAAVATTLAGGLALLEAAGRPAGELAAWAVQAAGMGALAVYASHAYARLRARERTASAERQAALERALLLEGEREARARAEEAVRARDEFLTVASHELKTPLTALKAQAQSAARDAAHPERGAAPLSSWAPRLGLLERQTDRLARLVETLLDVSRIRIGKLELREEEVDLGALAAEVAGRLGPALAQAGCPLELHCAPGATGRWDRTRLEQVLLNLLGNAMKYGAGRPILLSVEVEAQRVRLEVRDQGIGIPLEDQARIFGRFERAADSRQFAGLGLGLWICREIVLALGGEISVESRPGQGAAFRVLLPRRPAARSDLGEPLH